MVECEYCEDSFETEAAHLEHLGEHHAGELGRIDERRVAAATGADDEGLPIAGLLGGAAVLVVAAVAIWFLFLSGSGGGTDATGIEGEPLPESGDSKWISQVESFESEGINHVEQGSQINYAQSPPLSGPHWGRAISAGFYTETPELPPVVHTLEHGAIVIYYDADALSPEAEASLKAWSATHDGTWASILAVPNPNENPKGDYVLTAWTHRLIIDDYDAEAVRAFAAEYIGRGPENPVR
jgi:hypothetical protein